MAGQSAQILTLAKAAKQLGVSRSTMNNWVARGCPHLTKPKRVNVSEARRWAVTMGLLSPGSAGAGAGGPAPTEPVVAPDPSPPAPVADLVARAAGDGDDDEALDLSALREALNARALTDEEYRRVVQAHKWGQAQKEQAHAQIKRLAAAKEAGDLVSREKAQEHRIAVFSVVRDRVMQIATRCIEDVLELGDDVARAEARLKEECRWALEELSRG